FNHPATTSLYTLSLHDALPIFLHRLSGVICQDFVHAVSHPHDVLRMNVDLRRLTAEPTAHDQRLMNHHARVRQAVTFPLFSGGEDRKSTRLNSSHRTISYAVFC